jgi:Zn-finger nucleic acid-binding protein
MRKRLHNHACPECKQFLVPKTEHGVAMYACPQEHGAWLDQPALKTLLKEHKG